LSDLRRGKNTRHLLTGLLRQSVYGRLAGYEDVLLRPVRWGASRPSGWRRRRTRRC
jgi:hypothetical protein